MAKAIQTNEANVKTTAVEVKVIKISNHQVTQSVFRQLVQEDLIDPLTVQLRGVPWGFVNYFWGPCSANHLHVIWQKGSELRRACVWRHRRGNHPRLADEEEAEIRHLTEMICRLLRLHLCGERLLGRVTASVALTTRPDNQHIQDIAVSYKLAHLYWTLRGTDQEVLFDFLKPPDRKPREKYFYHKPLGERRLESQAEVEQRLQEHEGNARDSLQREQARLLKDLQLDSLPADLVWAKAQQLEDHYMKAKTLRDNRSRQWNERYDELAALDQLFIAV